ncbi:PTS system mannose/fructose/sorbose family transporter subunit IID [Klebsiella pneumoniae]|nr:PTS system mannose/fructose/sorbose family transporter subunit IID [Klebsiella pneumoniae]
MAREHSDGGVKITGSDGQVHVTTVQTILDQLMPGLVPLLLTFACAVAAA